MESEEEMEVDGIESAHAPTKRTADSAEKLQAGFGFTKDTNHARLSTDKDQCTEQDVNTNSQENVSPSFARPYNQGANSMDSRHTIVTSEYTSSMSVSDVNAGTNEVIETDTIYTQKLQERVLQAPPLKVPHDYVDMSPKKLPTNPKMTCLCMIPIGKHTPDATSDIYIRHERADDPAGDTFGARLSTFNDKRKDGTLYFRHFLVRIQPSGPADQMKIDDNDELVLVNENFAPQFTHEEVLEQFRNVQVDGKTRFTLVIRRVIASRSKKWEWIETSAIFAPDRATEEHPHIEKVAFKELKGERIELPKSQHLYKVPGTQQYLDICDGRVLLAKMNGDKTDETKVLWKRAKYWQEYKDEIHINFAAALADFTMKQYIDIKNDKVILTGEPVWFKMVRVGNKIRFQSKDVYLGYDLKSNEVKPEISMCTFEEFQPSDEILNNSNKPIDSMPENSDVVLENRPRHGSTASSLSSIYSHPSIASSVSSINSSRRSASSQSSVESDRSSILSSQASTDSGGVNHELNRSASDANDSYSEPSSLSLSQISGSSGYTSDIHVDTGDIDIIKPVIIADMCIPPDGIEDISGN